jgi:phosphatidylserine decarboxylase
VELREGARALAESPIFFARIVPIVRDGWLYILVPAIVTAACFYLRWTWAGGAMLVVTALMVNFFRDPERKIPDGPGVIVSPADGKVVQILDKPVNSPLGEKSRQISIFLSVFDVHVNRAPMAGTVQEVLYNEGKFLAAWNDKASLDNERNRATIDDGGFRVAFTQIAGAIARRIVFTKKAGDRVERGERVGMIKFGSRVDIFLPPDVTLAVKVGDRVKGGSSVIGRRP